MALHVTMKTPMNLKYMVHENKIMRKSSNGIELVNESCNHENVI